MAPTPTNRSVDRSLRASCSIQAAHRQMRWQSQSACSSVAPPNATTESPNHVHSKKNFAGESYRWEKSQNYSDRDAIPKGSVLHSTCCPGPVCTENSDADLPHDIEFKSPLTGPPQTVVLYGDPTKPGVFVSRVKFSGDPPVRSSAPWRPSR